MAERALPIPPSSCGIYGEMCANGCQLAAYVNDLATLGGYPNEQAAYREATTDNQCGNTWQQKQRAACQAQLEGVICDCPCGQIVMQAFCDDTARLAREGKLLPYRVKS